MLRTLGRVRLLRVLDFLIPHRGAPGVFWATLQMKTVRVALVVGIIAALASMAFFLSSTGEQLVLKMRGSREPFTGGAARRLVVMHAEWCGHCRTLLSSGGVWEQVKKSLPGVRVDEIDEATSPELVRALNVTSFPDIRVLEGDDTVASFDGERKHDAIVAFALKHVSP